MGIRRRLTSENVRDALQMRREGLTLDDVAAHFKCSKSTLFVRLKKCYGTTVPVRKIPPAPQDDGTFHYIGKKTLSLEELEWAYMRRAEHYTYVEIANALHICASNLKDQMYAIYGTGRPTRDEAERRRRLNV